MIALRMPYPGVGVLMLALLSCAGCGYRQDAFAPRVTPALGEMDAGGRFAHVQVLFATDRNDTGGADAASAFGGARTNTLKYGEAAVSIPQGHRRGRIERPGPLRAAAAESHVTCTALQRQPDRAAFVSRLRERVGADGDNPRPIFVFIHGFAVPFEPALLRTAQLTHDIEFDGVPILYSWPSEGWLLSYLVDGDNAEWSSYYLTEFLELLAQESGAPEIHLMAHSMGSRVLSRAVKDYLAGGTPWRGALRTAPDDQSGAPGGGDPGDERLNVSRRSTPFSQVVLAAADMDAALFERDYAPHLANAAHRVSLYVSQNDGALLSSQRLHTYARLGQGELTRVDLRLLLQRIEIIDVTRIDRTLLGHYYYGDSPDVLNDLQGVIRGLRADERGLTRRFTYVISER